MKKTVAIVAAIVAVAFPATTKAAESWPTKTWPSTQCSQTFPTEWKAQFPFPEKEVEAEKFPFPVTGGDTFPVCSWPSWPKG